MGGTVKLFVDTNIILDSLARRQPFEKKADLLFSLGFCKECELWTSASQFTDAFYILASGPQKVSTTTAKSVIKTLLKSLNVCNFTRLEVETALDSSWDDFEDACLYECAQKMKADAIITRNKGDFGQSRIPVMDCDELFAWLEQEHSLVYDFIDL